MTRSVFYNLASSEGERAHRAAARARRPHRPPCGVAPRRFGRTVRADGGLAQPRAGVHDGADRRGGQRDEAPWFDRASLPLGLEPALAARLPARGARAPARFEWLQLLIHPEIWAYDGATMRETMESFLDADQAAGLDRLRADRIDLS